MLLGVSLNYFSQCRTKNIVVFGQLLVYNGIYNTNDWGYTMNIPLRGLKDELKNNVETCKRTPSYDNTIISKAIFGLFSKLINKFEKEKAYQSGLFIKSLDGWLDRKDNDNQPLDGKIKEINIGDIYMVDWNLSYSPELSYEHPCVVIEKIGDFLFTLPVSGQKQFLEIGFHPTERADGDKRYRIVNIADGFSKKCVIHITQAKSISSTRILYKIGSLKTDEEDICELLNEIKEEMINIYFPIEYNKILEERNFYEKENKVLAKLRKQYQSKADKLQHENEILQQKICEMQSIIDKSIQ